MPPAYHWNPVSKELGNPRLLPLTYVSPNGAAIYLLKGREVKRLLVNGLPVALLTPWRELKADLQVTNATQPPTARLYVAIPCDYAGKVLEVSVNSSQHIVSLEVFKGLIPVDEARWWTTHLMLARSPPLREGLGTLNPRLKWAINGAGYLTIMVVSWDQRWEAAFNVTLHVKIAS
ncbi:MAG: hypothetical protein DRJ69_07025 [Thermoprotei archaeon]|nr:MAG: hypothetical protein DRJ69_07025 [Thermoprotei archaeon]